MDYTFNVMSVQTDNLFPLLKPFGLTPEESSIYLLLLSEGKKTALALSRQLHIGRTKVYRILDKLYQIGLVNQQVAERGLQFAAYDVSQLETLIKQKEIELNILKNNSSEIIKTMRQMNRNHVTDSQVRYYSGVEGLKQVTWNSLQTQNELLIMEIKDMSAFLNQQYCEKVREEFVTRKIHIRELSNQKRISAWTNVETLPNQFWQCRYLDPRELNLQFEVLIYNNVYAMYNYTDQTVFCVEIYDTKLTQMQKQLFNFLWNKAKIMKKTGHGGTCSV